MAHALRSVGAHSLSSKLLRRHQRSRRTSERRLGTAREFAACLGNLSSYCTFVRAILSQGTIAARYTSRCEADSGRTCCGRMMRSKCPQSSRPGWTTKCMPAYHDKRKYRATFVVGSLQGSLTPSSAPLISVPQLSQTVGQ